ncbi:tryptophan N-monooxygenase CYP79A68-like [Diospyros lotus]|uniref:tryptophan N-monooxygenase CYP79A68-like n=1 Tax=Diospyros lotus TaxID=55363 RepID=UPI00224FD5AA|nr:tryptophan N-monooxygenase CYP79A68-like [Diospyros lotus]
MAGSRAGNGDGVSTTPFFICSTFLFMALAFLIFHKHKAKRNKRSNEAASLPPGPKPWPIVGCLPEMLTNKPTFRWIHKLMEELDSEIICVRLGNVHVIPVTSPQLACEFLKKHDSVFSSRPICLSAELTSKYLTTALTPLGDQWKKMRRVLVSEVLSPARFRWLHNMRVEEADHLIRFVYNQTRKSSMIGGIVDIRVATQHFCGNVIRKMIFGKRFFGEGKEDGGPGVEEEEHIDALFTILLYLYAFCISDYIPWLRGKLDLDGHEKIMRKAVGTCRKYQDPLIEERSREWQKGTKEEKEDLLDVLLTLKNAHGSPLLSVEEIKAQIVELMIETVDNPSNAVEWALAEMLNQPETFKRAIEELDRVVGKERLVQESDLPHLNYVKACIKEAFRLHPLAPFNVPHVSVADTTVAGYFIPKGSHVLLSRPGLGRNPKVWEEPLEFRPERHLTEDGSEVGLNDPDLRILSFSIGRRGCVGVTLGSVMTTMLMARLLQGFTFKLPPNISKIDMKESADNMSRASPLLALAEPRLPENLYLSV